MRRAIAALVLLGALGPSMANAQTLVLCDAEWMDVERVLALITVEVDEPPRYVFRVTDCTEESATVAVSGPDGLAREREVRLASTAPEARSRLVALVLVEMVRLGTRERPEPPSDVPTAEGGVPTADPETEAPPTDVPEPVAEPVAPTSDAAAPESPIDRELPWAANPYEPFEGAEAIDSPPEPVDLDDPTGLAVADPCGGEGLATRLSARGCSTGLGVGLGVARHHLGNQAVGSLWPLQLRLRYRWRFLYVGVRVAGRRQQSSPFSGASVNVSTYSAFLGLELGSVRARHAVFAVGLQAEAGAVRYRELESVGGCSGTGFIMDCGEGPQVGARSTFGGMLSLRLEIPIREGALAFEVEGGWMRGLMVASSFEPVTGMGGAQLSFLIEATFGLGGAS